MAEEVQKNLPLSAEISAQIESASSTDEIQAALASAREALPAEPAKPVVEETKPQLFSDTFVIGGKEVEISGADAADVLRQYKAATTAYEIGRSQQAQPVAEVKAQKTPEEIQAARFELESNFRLGKITAKEYLKETGAVDDYLREQGIDPAKVKLLLEKEQSRDAVKSWEDATTEFTSNFGKSGTPWPGGPRVLDLMGKTLIELGLADKPSSGSLQQAYDHLTQKGWNLIEIGNEDTAAKGDKPKVDVPPPPPPKKKLNASGLFNVSGNSGAKDLGRPPEVPKIDAEDSPQQILDKWKAANLAAGRNPDDALRETYGVSRVQ